MRTGSTLDGFTRTCDHCGAPDPRGPTAFLRNPDYDPTIHNSLGKMFIPDFCAEECLFLYLKQRREALVCE